MRTSGWNPRRWRGRTLAAFTAAAVVATSAVTAAPAAADPKPNPGKAHDIDGHGPRDVDNRRGGKAPTAKQKAAADRVGGDKVRWNALGEPEAVGPDAALATGLTGDPVAAARKYLLDNQDLYALDASAVDAMDPIFVQPLGTGTVVQLQQRFGNLPAGHDGLVAILLNEGNVVRVTSSLSRDTTAPEPATLSVSDAVAAALADAGLTAGQISAPDVLEVAVPTPQDGPRAAYQVTLVSTDADNPIAYSTFVDARTGEILVREDMVDFDSDNPSWAVYPTAAPQQVTPGNDSRVTWCFTPLVNCAKTVSDASSGKAWDVNQLTGQPTFTSSGNSANNVVQWGGGVAAFPAATKTDRNYNYAFTDQWHESKCNPDVFTSARRNDADAAVSNLFGMHNRMHDFSYHLGFTEAAWNMQVVNNKPGGLGNDPELGRAQSGALSGSRNNANQSTGRDGAASTTNMYLWQPVAGSAYPPCVDGDYDMTVIGHEYTHAITNRMIAGPNNGITGTQGGSMGEAWSDLVAAEYLYENGLRAPGDTEYVTGAYVTGNLHEGIRDYDASKSPLNYSDFGFDLVGPEVHADGEIWVATNLRVRKEFVSRYGLGTPELQQKCADGLADVASCPGNRRWIQLMFDSFLLQAASGATMTSMRDNMLAADLVRFGGANQDIIWKGFAESGLGEGATGAPSDHDPTPSFHSPYADNATVTLRPMAGSAGANITLYVGDYEARVTPVADTDPSTPLPDTFQILPNTEFHFVVNGKGWGSQKFTATFKPGKQDLKLKLPQNVASSALGAVATGDGVNLPKINDETEATNWASVNGVAGKQVTIDLAGDKPVNVQSLNISALLRPALKGDVDSPTANQNRFSALRSFAVLTCDATKADCSQDSSYKEAYRSNDDAFPGGAWRPVAPQLNLRTFDIHPTLATHVRVVVLSSQCTGNPFYAGEQDNDPRANTDCATNSPFRNEVRIAEVQVFGSSGNITPGQ
ncbi:M36 family metallopeptidase [Dactylosporangium sp. NPDC051485]|uniref:M36 family metallopeptidase n=1 Tax=Dactylosporangium sp. NPDC051485 TaxID=3154846 RepID=UPI003416AEE9